MYVDSHAHYDDSRYHSDRHELLINMHNNGVDFIVNAGASMVSTKKGIELAEKYDFIYAAAGVHPHDVKNLTDKDLIQLEEYTHHPKVVAIGEIGLDYYYEHSPKDTQRTWFNKQLTLAEKVNLPVIIHSRDASEETFNTICNSNVRSGVIHCYSGSAEMAVEYVKMGFYIGIGGVVTFPKAKKTVEVVKRISIDHILIETDCPYLSPEPNRGKRNDSHNLSFIVEKIAQIKQITPLELANVTKTNAISLFSLK